MDFLFSPLTPEKIENKGQKLYCIAKIGMIVGLLAIALTLVIGLLTLAFDGDSFIDAFIFDIDDDYAFAYLFVVIAYLGLAYGSISVPMYFYSLNLYSLGKIAKNTEK